MSALGLFTYLRQTENVYTLYLSKKVSPGINVTSVAGTSAGLSIPSMGVEVDSALGLLEARPPGVVEGHNSVSGVGVGGAEEVTEEASVDPRMVDVVEPDPSLPGAVSVKGISSVPLLRSASQSKRGDNSLEMASRSISLRSKLGPPEGTSVAFWAMVV